MPLNSSVNVSGGGAASAMVGATAGTPGLSGSVPAPAAGGQNSRLTGGGTWVAPEFGYVNLAAQTLSAGSQAYVDVTGSSMALTAGTWQITYSVATDHTGNLAVANVAMLVVTDSANAIVEGSQTSRPGSNTSAFGLSRTFHLVVATPTTYKLRVSNGDTSGAISILNSTAHKSTLAWSKLS